jgi:hypothetical protein
LSHRNARLHADMAASLVINGVKHEYISNSPGRIHANMADDAHTSKYTYTSNKIDTNISIISDGRRSKVVCLCDIPLVSYFLYYHVHVSAYVRIDITILFAPLLYEMAELVAVTPIAHWYPIYYHRIHSTLNADELMITDDRGENTYL